MSNLLDTFLILFESDASEVKKGAEDAEKAVDDLEDSLDGAEDTAVELGASFGEMAKQAGIALLALVSISAARDGLINTAASVDELGKLTNRLGESVEEVDAWSGAAVRAGGTAAGFRGALESLNEKIVDTAIKGTGELLPFFNQMGISMVDANKRARSTLDILPELADAFQKLSKQESAGIGRKLGLDDGTILLLQSGRGEIEKLLKRQKELGLVTKEQALVAAQFNDQLADMGQAFNTVGRLIAIELLPFITKFMDMVTDAVVFLKNNKSFAVAFFGAIGVAISTLLIPPLLTAIGLIAPFLAIGAAAVVVAGAFALAADDVWNFLEGNKSVIGELSKSWPIVGAIIEAATEAMAFAFSSPIEKLKTMKEIVNSIRDAWKDLKESISTKGMGKVFDETIESAKAFIGISATSPINTQTPNTISNSVSRGGDKTFNMGGVNVDARGGGSESAGRAMGNAAGSQLRKAVDSFDDGVLA